MNNSSYVDKAGAVPRLFVQVEFFKEDFTSLQQLLMEDWKKELTGKRKGTEGERQNVKQKYQEEERHSKHRTK